MTSTEHPAPEQLAHALADLAAGRPIVVVDDEDRENEGDLIAAADRITPQWMGFLVRHSSGVVCAPLGAESAARLGLPPMVAENQDPKRTAYTVSCDAATGISTGISAADRTRTARLLADPTTVAGDLTRPGHLFPLIAKPGGVRERAGHTEATIDLLRLAGCAEAGVIAELVHDEGHMMRRDALDAFAAEHGLALITIEALAAHLEGLDTGAGSADPLGPPPVPAVQATDPVVIPTAHGPFTAQAWTVDGIEHLSLTNPVASDAAPLVRLHSECLTGDVFGSRRCDCGEQLDAALAAIARHGGSIVYLRGHEGRGIGLANKLRAYALQDGGADTVDANTQLGLPVDARSYAPGAAILAALGHRAVRLLTNNPDKTIGLRAHGIDITGTVPLELPTRPENRRYLATKRDRLHHQLDLV